MDTLSIPPFLVEFWLGGPLLSDSWRLYMYGGLLLLAVTSKLHQPPWGDSPLQAPEVVGVCPASLYVPAGVVRFAGAFFYDVSVLRLLRGVVVVAWVASAVGAGGRLPPLITGIGALWLHGALAGAIGTNHRWAVPTVVLLAAGFTDARGPSSVDGLLSHTFAAYPFPLATSHAGLSSIVTRVALVAAVLTLFAAGVSKLRLGGLRWLDGKSIRFHMSRPDAGAAAPLKETLTRHLSVCRALAIFTLLAELASPLALLSDSLRPLIFLCAAILHVGIWLTMNPNYLPQAWCYPLFLRSAEGTGGAAGDSHTLLIAILTIAAVAFAAAALAGVEWWPFTCVPMYAFYRGDGFSHDGLRDLRQAEALAAEFCRSRLPWPLGWAKDWVAVRVKRGTSGRRLTPVGVTEKHWRRLLHAAGALHWAEKEPASDLLVRHRSFLRAALTEDEQHDPDTVLELFAPIGGRDVVLARIRVDGAVAADQQAPS